MNALAQVPAKPLTVSDCSISERLWTLLSADRPAEDAVDEILATPGCLTECRLAAPQLLALARGGCDEETVKRLLQPLVLVYGVSDGARTAAFWKVYFKALCDQPTEAVAAAVDAFSRLPDAEFFPKPGPLRALAIKAAEPIWRAANISFMAVRAKPRPQVDRGTPEQRAAFAEQMRQDAAKLGSGLRI